MQESETEVVWKREDTRPRIRRKTNTGDGTTWEKKKANTSEDKHWRWYDMGEEEGEYVGRQTLEMVPLGRRRRRILRKTSTGDGTTWEKKKAYTSEDKHWRWYDMGEEEGEDVGRQALEMVPRGRYDTKANTSEDKHWRWYDMGEEEGEYVGRQALEMVPHGRRRRRIRRKTNTEDGTTWEKKKANTSEDKHWRWYDMGEEEGEYVGRQTLEMVPLWRRRRRILRKTNTGDGTTWEKKKANTSEDNTSEDKHWRWYDMGEEEGEYTRRQTLEMVRHGRRRRRIRRKTNTGDGTTWEKKKANTSEDKHWRWYDMGEEEGEYVGRQTLEMVRHGRRRRRIRQKTNTGDGTTWEKKKANTSEDKHWRWYDMGEGEGEYVGRQTLEMVPHGRRRRRIRRKTNTGDGATWEKKKANTKTELDGMRQPIHEFDDRTGWRRIVSAAATPQLSGSG